MSSDERLKAIEVALSEVAEDWSHESLMFILTQYIDAETLENFAAERCKTFIDVSEEYGFECSTKMLLSWLDGWVIGVKYMEKKD